MRACHVKCFVIALDHSPIPYWHIQNLSLIALLQVPIQRHLKTLVLVLVFMLLAGILDAYMKFILSSLQCNGIKWVKQHNRGGNHINLMKLL